jgi:hypothetical protein
MSLLTRKAILQADDLPREKIDVLEWGGFVFVRALTGAERDAYEAACLQKSGKSYEANLANVRAKLCALAICDENGVRLFDDADVETLGTKSAAALDRVFAVARRLSKIGPEDMEELAKNSTSALGGASSLPLPGRSGGLSANCAKPLTQPS